MATIENPYNFPPMSPEGVEELMNSLKDDSELVEETIERIRTPSPSLFNNLCNLKAFECKIEETFPKKNSKRRNSKSYVTPIHPYPTRNRHLNKSLSYNTRSKKMH